MYTGHVFNYTKNAKFCQILPKNAKKCHFFTFLTPQNDHFWGKNHDRPPSGWAPPKSDTFLDIFDQKVVVAGIYKEN